MGSVKGMRGFLAFHGQIRFISVHYVLKHSKEPARRVYVLFNNTFNHYTLLFTMKSTMNISTYLTYKSKSLVNCVCVANLPLSSLLCWSISSVALRKIYSFCDKLTKLERKQQQMHAHRKLYILLTLVLGMASKPDMW